LQIQHQDKGVLVEVKPSSFGRLGREAHVPDELARRAIQAVQAVAIGNVQAMSLSPFCRRKTYLKYAPLGEFLRRWVKTPGRIRCQAMADDNPIRAQRYLELAIRRLGHNSRVGTASPGRSALSRLGRERQQGKPDQCQTWQGEPGHEGS